MEEKHTKDPGLSGKDETRETRETLEERIAEIERKRDEKISNLSLVKKGRSVFEEDIKSINGSKGAKQRAAENLKLIKTSPLEYYQQLLTFYQGKTENIYRTVEAEYQKVVFQIIAIIAEAEKEIRELKMDNLEK